MQDRLHHPAAPSRQLPQGMSRTGRILLILFGATAVCVFGTLSAIAYATHAVLTSPSVQVRVHDKVEGHKVHVLVPASLVAAGMTVAPWLIPDEAMAELRYELEAELDHLPVDIRLMAAEMVLEIREMPDATLVEVVDGTDHVTVDKVGSDLVIRVRSLDADVDVEVPVALLQRALDFIDA